MDPVVKKRLGVLINAAYFALILAAFYLVFKTFFPILMPFIVAFLIAAILHRPVKLIARKTPFNRTVVSTIFVLLILAVLGLAVFLLGNYLVSKVKSFYEFLMLKLKDFPAFVEQIRQWSLSAVGVLPEGLRTSLTENMTDFFDKLAANGVKGLTNSFSLDWSSVLPKGVGVIRDTVGQIPSVAIAVIISIIACVFVTVDYDRITGFIYRQFNPANRKKLHDARSLARRTLAQMGKAYGLIILITTAELTLGFYIMKFCKIFNSDYIILIAFIIALIDIIPVLGTGTVLIPWAVYSFVTADVPLGIGLLILYAVILVIRQIIEPRLVAGQVGLPPIVTIAAMYVGTKTLSVIGFFVMPFCVILIKKFNDEGIIHIFKRGGAPEAIPAAETAPAETAPAPEPTDAAE